MDQVNTEYDDMDGTTEKILNETETTRIPAHAILHYKSARKNATNLQKTTKHDELPSECMVKAKTPQIPTNYLALQLKMGRYTTRMRKKLRLLLKDYYRTRQETPKQDHLEAT